MGARATTTKIANPAKGTKPIVCEIFIYAFVIFFLSAGTYWRNRIWMSETALWADCMKKSPNKDRPHLILGNALFHDGMYQEAIAQYIEAIHRNPNLAEAHNNLGSVFLNQGKYEEAILHFSEALRIKPNFAEASNNLGHVLLKQRK